MLTLSHNSIITTWLEIFQVISTLPESHPPRLTASLHVGSDCAARACGLCCLLQEWGYVEGKDHENLLMKLQIPRNSDLYQIIHYFLMKSHENFLTLL